MTTEKTIATVERMRSSVYGNPRYRFIFTDGTSIPTAPDAGFAYGVGNRDLREGATIVPRLNGRGHMVGFEPVSEAPR